MTESELEDAVRDACQRFGLLAYHPYNSQRSEPGFPDWTIVGPGGLIFRELKGIDVNGRLGRLTPAQRQWLDVLKAAGQDAGVWTPHCWADGRVLSELGPLRMLADAIA